MEYKNTITIDPTKAPENNSYEDNKLLTLFIV